jgi:hypothetical protein
MATLKTWRLLRKLRCSTTRITSLVQAVLTLHLTCANRGFSVRAWCSGAEIVLAPGIEIAHRFKPAHERDAFVASARTALLHNCLRFGVAYLPELMILEMVRLHALEFPDHIQAALHLLEQRDAWRRRAELAKTRTHDFEWFVDRFALHDQAGRPIPVPGMTKPASGHLTEPAMVALEARSS